MSIVNRSIFYKEKKQFNSKRKIIINIQERYLTNEINFVGENKSNNEANDTDVTIYLITLETLNFVEILIELIQ